MSISLKHSVTYALAAINLALIPAIASAQDTTRTAPGRDGQKVTGRGDQERVGKEDAFVVLKAAGTFKTFLALAERAKLTSLLTGAMIDSAPEGITFRPIQKTWDIRVGKVSGGSDGSGAASVGAMFKKSLDQTIVDGWKREVAKPGVLTIFAPTDAAFAKLPAKELAAMLADSAAAAAVVRTHIINRGIYAARLSAIAQLRVLQGYSYPLTSKTIGDAEFVDTNLFAGNAVIHSLGTVLRPPVGNTNAPKPQ